MATLITVAMERMSPLTPLSPIKMKERKFGMILKRRTRKRRFLDRVGDTGDSGDIIVYII
jgi:hypothetical protein